MIQTPNCSITFHFPPKHAAAVAELFQLCPTLCDPTDGSPLGSPCPWDSPGKNTGVGCHFLLQCFMGYRVAKSQTRLKQLSIQARTTGLASSLSKILTVLGVEFYFIFKLYIIVLVFPNIKMNPPQVYMCSPS